MSALRPTAVMASWTVPFSMRLVSVLFKESIHNGQEHLPPGPSVGSINGFTVVSFCPLMTQNVKEVRIGRVCGAFVFFFLNLLGFLNGDFTLPIGIMLRIYRQ